MKKIIISVLFVLFSVLIYGLSLRGIAGNPSTSTISSPAWGDNGPFELSPDRGRFALLFSVVEDQSTSFSIPVARFATPDLATINGKYVSLFAPGLSYLLIPGYLVGKVFSVAQVGTFAVIALFAVINGMLIFGISRSFRASRIASVLAAGVFQFATPSFAYAVSLYQHQVSTFLILASLYVLVRYRGWWATGVVWFLFACSIPVDYPNLFLMFPIALYSLGRVVYVQKKASATVISVKVIGVLSLFSVLIPLLLFTWFNQVSYGNPLQISGTLKSVKGIGLDGKPLTVEQLNSQAGVVFEKQDLNRKKTATGFFKTRNLINGIYEHTISADRGILWFTPIVLFGIFGFVFLYRSQSRILPVFIGIISANILLYSMWSDPYGGWAFGSRYLIPAYSVFSIGIAIALTRLKDSKLFLIFFLVVCLYSTGVNTLGALTTNRNPPKVETLALEKLTNIPQKYTYERNIDYLRSNKSKSFIWQTVGKKYLTAETYFYIVYGILASMMIGLVLVLHKKKEVLHD